MIYQPEKKCIIGFIKILEDQKNTIYQKIKMLIKCKFCIINVIEKNHNLIFEIPVCQENENKSEKKKRKVKELLKKRINSEIKKNNIEAVVFSSEIKKIINKDDIVVPVLNGKILMKNSVVDILKKIADLNKQDISLMSIYILVKKYNKENLDIIYDLSNKVKNINIITENIHDFKKLEEKLLNKNGIAISVANNRKKGMRRAQIIINLDMDKDTLKKYCINRDTIIINCIDEKIELDPSFSGVIINGIVLGENIEQLEFFKINNIYKKYNISELYESLIFNKNYDKIVQRKKKDNVILTEFMGSRGIINIKEIQDCLAKNKNNLTKH